MMPQILIIIGSIIIAAFLLFLGGVVFVILCLKYGNREKR